MNGAFMYLTGSAGPSGYGSKSTAEQVAADCTLSDRPLTAIITGGTSGIGAKTAEALASVGVRIVMAVRDLVKATDAKKKILKEYPNAEILILEVDLSSMASVANFCHTFLCLDIPLHILINNAGIFAPNLEFSKDTIEMTLATNYLGHFLMTDFLMEKMVATAKETGIEGRIVNLSSVVHRWVKRGGFCFDDIVAPEKYNGPLAYAQTKLANILHAKEISKQLRVKNANLTINSVHPGIVKTEIIRSRKGLIMDTMYFIGSKLLKSPSQGAATSCYVALSQEIGGKSGKYFADCNESSCSALVSDELLAKKLCSDTRSLILKKLKSPESTFPINEKNGTLSQGRIYKYLVH